MVGLADPQRDGLLIIQLGPGERLEAAAQPRRDFKPQRPGGFPVQQDGPRWRLPVLPPFSFLPLIRYGEAHKDP